MLKEFFLFHSYDYENNVILYKVFCFGSGHYFHAYKAHEWNDGSSDNKYIHTNDIARTMTVSNIG